MEEFDWEAAVRERVSEVEEMRELERKAEELVRDGGGEEETEEDKRTRVRKELEKVFFFYPLRGSMIHEAHSVKPSGKGNQRSRFAVSVSFPGGFMD